MIQRTRSEGEWERYILAACPFDPNHGGGESSITQRFDGALGFQCFHDGCAHKKWADVRRELGNPHTDEYEMDPGFSYDSNGNGNGKGASYAAREAPSSVSYPTYTAAELESLDLEITYWVDGVLVKDQPCILGGPKKSLKTSLAMDLAISLVLGKPFLGRFEVIEKCNVLMMSGESGLAVLRRTAQTICRAKGQTLSDLGPGMVWSDRLPQFGQAEHSRALAELLDRVKPRVMIIDPAYLCMPGTDANNLFSMGELLIQMNELCQEREITMVLIHHAKKTDRKDREKLLPMELDDLAWTGFAEWARQWIFTTPRVRYAPGTNKHELWLGVGGSAGHGGEWALTVDVGQPNDPIFGPQWDVLVQDEAGIKQQEWANQQEDLLQRCGEILASRQDGLSLRQLRVLLGGNRERTEHGIQQLIANGFLAETVSRARNGAETTYVKLGNLG